MTYFAIEHPSLFSIGIQRTLPSPELWPQFRAAATDALGVLSWRLVHLQESELLGGRTLRDAILQFHSLCEGLAAVELRGTFPSGDEERIWREALVALIAGFATAPYGNYEARQPHAGARRPQAPPKR